MSEMQWSKTMEVNVRKGETMLAHGKGKVQVKMEVADADVTIHDVCFVPGLWENVFSIPQMRHQTGLGCIAFWGSDCFKT